MVLLILIMSGTQISDLGNFIHFFGAGWMIQPTFNRSIELEGGGFGASFVS